MGRLSVQEILDAGLDDWRRLSFALHARFRTGDFARGLSFVAALGEAAERRNHHPDVTLRLSYVDLRLFSHDVGGVTDRDIRLAREISEIARTQGVPAEPHVLGEFELGLDTADLAAVSPFWSALLTGRADAADGDEVVDPRGRVPALWFQGTEPHETPRQRFHVDLWVPHDVAEERIAAAVSAGGTVVDDRQAPTFVVLADAEGNHACVCTCLGR